MTKLPRYIMVGGFLGAGKTTAVARLARHLTEQGMRVGLITNDQGAQLVDTANLTSRGFAVEEIPGGCFCCRFNSLVEAARKLSRETSPDVFIAEPVGSCTDLVATVSYPLRRIYGNEFTIAPLSVLVDPARASKMLGLEDGTSFSEKVLYIYRKQLEEADIIVINKCDLLEPHKLKALHTALAVEFPAAGILEVSARNETGLEPWFHQITTAKLPVRTSMVVDYEIYAQGEALLGWLNATVNVSAPEPLDGNSLLRSLAGELQALLKAAGGEIAHLKITMDPEASIGELAVISLVGSEVVPELSHELEDQVQEAQIIVNIRAEVSPEILEQSLQRALAKTRNAFPCTLKMDHLEHFRPCKPEPTHRFTDAG
ncbi:MAG TPA: GTP-binding protein [Candidatus Saccharimonadales bacterium]|nr:GTP-binding protein [Candidatus Saccharimonadales bacterium]